MTSRSPRGAFHEDALLAGHVERLMEEMRLHLKICSKRSLAVGDWLSSHYVCQVVRMQGRTVALRGICQVRCRMSLSSFANRKKVNVLGCR